MMTVTITFEAIALYFFAASIAALSGYALLVRRRTRARVRKSKLLVSAVMDFFCHRDAEVDVDCVPQERTGRFVVFIDSEPLLRMRYSHLIEKSLRIEVRRQCGIEIARVYWRFASKKEAADTPRIRLVKNDSLATDEYARWRELAQSEKACAPYEVSVAPWEQFEKVYRKA